MARAMRREGTGAGLKRNTLAGRAGSMQEKCGFVPLWGRKTALFFLFFERMGVYTEKMYIYTPIICENGDLAGRFFCIGPR